MRLIVLCILLTGCGAFQRSCTRFTGELTYKCSRSGVEYVQSDSGISPHLNADGSPVKCDESK